MSSIEELWTRLEETGSEGATRVDATHPSDLYGAIDGEGHVGLLLVCNEEPPPAPTLEAVEVSSSRRHDGRWALGIWLQEAPLRPVFAQLCEDLIETSRLVASANATAQLLTRLIRWRQLLEGGAGSMSMTELRGLVGELLVLERCLDLWAAAEVVSGWVGPLDSPQDFVLPGRRIEVKTIFASARAVRITSLDQLDTDEPLLLAVVTLTTLVGSGDGLAPAALVERLSGLLRGAADELVVTTFEKRLKAARWAPDPAYERPMFRLDGVQYFEVGADFPRIRRADVGAGIGKVVYDILIGSCAPYRTPLLR